MTEKENKSELNSPAAATPDDDSQSLEDTIRKIKPYIDKLWAKKKQFLIFNGVVAVLAVIGLLLFAKPYFNSYVSVLPEYGSQSTMLGGLTGLASMAGFNVGDVTPTRLYEQILKSQKVISDVAYRKYKTDEFKDSVNLIEYFEIETSDDTKSITWQERDKFLVLYKKFTEDIMSIDVDRETTILLLLIQLPEPRLSAEVANALTEALNDYITTDRQSYAREQSEYIFNRINEVRDSLKIYEEQLKVFRETNRAISNSPQLTLEQNRLIRNVEIAQSVYIELTKQYELIKLEEVKDTPVVNIMEKAEAPVKKAGPRRTLILVLILFLSSIISSIYFMFYDTFLHYFYLLKK